MFNIPRDVSPPITFSEIVCKTPRALDLAHSALFSVAGRDGELTAIDCLVVRTHRDVARHAEDVTPPPDGQGMSARPVQKMYP